MKTTVDYSTSPCPDADCILDIKDYLGDRWETVSEIMKPITDTDQFMIAASFVGIHGRPVRAWYDLYHGQGAFAKAFKL